MRVYGGCGVVIEGCEGILEGYRGCGGYGEMWGVMEGCGGYGRCVGVVEWELWMRCGGISLAFPTCLGGPTLCLFMELNYNICLFWGQPSIFLKVSLSSLDGQPSICFWPSLFWKTSKFHLFLDQQ